MSSKARLPDLGMFTVFLVPFWILWALCWPFLRAGLRMMVFCVRLGVKGATKSRQRRAVRRIEAEMLASTQSAQPAQMQTAQAAVAPATPAAPAAAPTPQAAVAPANVAAAPATALAVVEAPQAIVEGHQAVATAGPEKYKSGVHGSELEIADRHALRKIGGRTYRFSYYRDAGKVLRFDVKAKTELPVFLRSHAASRKTAFGLEEAIEFTSWELAVARKKEAEGTTASRPASKPAKAAAPAAAGPQQTEVAPPTSDAPPMDDIPPMDEVPVWMDLGDSRSNDAPMAPTFSRDTDPGSSEDEDASKVIQEGETEWDSREYQGVIVEQGIVKREPRGKRPYKIFSMTLQLPDGETKEFTGVELNELVRSFKLAKGDTITIRKGVLSFTIVEPHRREDRTKNVYALKVVARALRSRKVVNG